ncbi:DNA adenine methylase [Staphylococcus hominis]|uniref:DNA adenine methylase n=1 Tax=Staphylococcus hominis TaxID=1290 RepID=UPI0008A178DB|nr:DNA adenine methylase [Staphylococcus hominis]MBF2316559.1 DNA adenine methylase [Staphylococcus hominis]MBF2320839.1 DNA adenine methylase [Staphylococcus hominis]OFS51254.1 DNA methyltransferase [Staphylococcus sp. HMSC075H09]
MPVTKSPLRYPGGKTQLNEFVANVLNINGLENVTYCEPFSGGFGLGLELLLSGKVDKAIINDYDIAIFSLWYSILNDTYSLISLIKETPINIDSWIKQKKIYEEKKNDNKYSIELAFSTLFLNRTNHSGIISGGPIGGYNQISKYKLNCRFNKEKIIEKIYNIYNMRNKIELYNYEANELIEKVLLKRNKENIFIYLDPPYYKQGKNLYKNFFTHDDHIKLEKSINELHNFHWMITYDFEENIKYIYSKYPFKVYKIRYSAKRFRKEKEYIFTNPKTLIEEVSNIIFDDF